MQLAIDNESGQTFLVSPISLELMMTKNESFDFSAFPKYSVMASIDNVSDFLVYDCNLFGGHGEKDEESFNNRAC